MRIGVVAVAVLVWAIGGGCFAPDFEDGTTQCGPGGECPTGLLCAADRKCYHTGRLPDSCDAGFERSSTGTCVDIDECARATDTCDENAVCTNTPGSYTCACKSGFSGDGRSCADVDECRAGSDDCDVHASCANTAGGYICTCDPGYSGDGKTCAQALAQIATAGDHSCARRSDGALLCWGANGVGQLGAGASVTEAKAPLRIGSDLWQAVATGFQYTCGIKMDGTLWCWGDGACAVLGDGGDNLYCDGARPVYAPYPTGGAATWKSLSAGEQHACAIQSDGSLWCWGENDQGELGTSDADPRTVPTRIGADVAADKTWTAIAAGWRHTCGVRSGQLWCWGANDFGQLGDNGAVPSISFPKRIGTSASFVTVAAGDGHTCAVLGDKTLACWGDGAAGQLGLGDGALATGASTPTPVPGAMQWAEVAASGINTCGRTTGGALYCFGDNRYGQVGDGTFVQRSSPASVAGGGTWAQVALGFRETCATSASGQGSCWGQNSDGSIGAGTGGEADAPIEVASSGFTQLATGARHQCGIKTDASLWCWGANGDGQLGIGVDGGFRDAPTRVAGGGTWSSVTAGDHSTCGIQTDGALLCWGVSFHGELGLGDEGSAVHDAPTPVASGGTWSRVSTRLWHTCGVQTDGTLWCWGLSSAGRLGLGSEVPATVDAPALVDGGGYTAVSVGDTHTCAVQGGALVCFGENSFGQLGTGQQPPANVSLLSPVIVGSYRDWSMVAAGQYHTCGIRAPQSYLFCWGYNYDGQVGDGSSGASANAWDPDTVAFGTSWLAVTAGDYTTCGVGMDGKLRCWGSNFGGLVGNGNAGEIVVTPVVIGGAASDFVAVGLMTQAGCALHGDGGYACWGLSPNGEFGDDTSFYESPVQVKDP